MYVEIGHLVYKFVEISGEYTVESLVPVDRNLSLIERSRWCSVHSVACPASTRGLEAEFRQPYTSS